PAALRRHLPAGSGPNTPQAQEQVLAALTELSLQLRECRDRDRPDLLGLGATVVFALVQPEYALVAHLGDSRAYLQRGPCLARLTHDHTLTYLLLQSGKLDPAEAADHWGQEILAGYVGMKGLPVPEARLVALQPGDRLLLCSDGLNNLLSD